MSGLRFPLDQPPAFGRTLEVAPGILWLRLPLPFRLNHVNVYLLDDGEGWTIVDAGIDDARTRDIWRDVIGTTLQGRPVRRVVVTHFHPDHVGAAAFLCALTGAALMMGETEYLTAKVHGLAGDADLEAEQAFYRSHGLDADHLAAMRQRLGRYRSGVPDLPRSFEPMRDGDDIRIGGRQFRVRSFAGHSPAQMLLHSAEDDLLFAADHVLAQISPNVSVAEDKPTDDPLGLYLSSFAEVRSTIADTVLVLPGHRLPFLGLHDRTRELASHHAARCAEIVEACRPNPLSVAEIVPLLFPMHLDAHQYWFAFSETLAHVNHMVRAETLALRERDGLKLWAVSDDSKPRIAEMPS